MTFPRLLGVDLTVEAEPEVVYAKIRERGLKCRQEVVVSAYTRSSYCTSSAVAGNSSGMEASCDGSGNRHNSA